MSDQTVETLEVGIVLFLIAGAGLLLVYLNEKEHGRLRAAWKSVMAGTFDYVIYGCYDYTVRTGSGMARRLVTREMKTTAVHFADGRACVVDGRLDMPFPQGRRIRVLKNGLGEYRVEEI